MVVRRRAIQMFGRLSAGDWESVLAHAADDLHHVFPGEHALGGERHSRRAVASWFERLHRLFPEHCFHVERVLADGWPWNTWVAVQWTADLTPARGQPYRQAGTHWVRIRWGKVTHLHAYLDTQLVARACDDMANQGVAEATAAPITA